MSFSRRAFLGAAAAGAAALAANGGAGLQLCLFSKPLPDLGYDELGRTVKELGFAGIDLTVRSKGHVLPDRVTEDLPRAIDAFDKHGLRVPMVTTELTSAQDATARNILRTASRLGVTHFKPGYWRYGTGDVTARVKQVGQDVRGLADLAAEHRIAMGLHNHSGTYVGEAVWDTWEMIRDLDPRWTGFYYDAGHATVEGGLGGHEITLRLALPRLKMVALKDFYWQQEGAQWKTIWCPIGNGAVDWRAFFGAIQKADFHGPVSLHMEYPTDNAIASIRHDIEYVKRQLAAV